MSTTTPGRLHTDGGTLIFDADGDVIAHTRTAPRYAEEAANARRLAACWNFCEALSTDTLEQCVEARAR